MSKGSAAQTERMCSLQGDFDLTLFQDGLLPSAFLVGVPPALALQLRHKQCTARAC